jgi:disulfide bond formation protein DsbB
MPRNIWGLVPCEMCWWQRYAHFAALGLAVAAGARLRRLAVMLAGLALATAALIGGYHAGVEYGWWKGMTECTSAVSFAGGGDPLAAIMAAPSSAAMWCSGSCLAFRWRA